jgi:hypothetical protein
LLALDPPDIPFILEPELLSFGGSMFIYGKAETLKTWLAINLMFSIASANTQQVLADQGYGQSWIVYPTKRAKVLMLQTEQVEVMYRDRIVSWTRHHVNGNQIDLDDYMTFVTSQDLKLDDFRGQALLEDLIKEHLPRVVILDCLYRMVKSTKEESSLKPFFDFLATLQSRYHVAFVVIHHPRKEDMQAEDSAGFEDMTGWAGLTYWADTILRVTHVHKESDKYLIRLQWEKAKNAKGEVGNVTVKLHTDNLTFVV